MQHGGATVHAVYPGVTQVVYGDVPVTAVVSPFHDGSATVASIVTLHYKTRGGLDLPILEYTEDARTHIKQAKLGTLEYSGVTQAITV